MTGVPGLPAATTEPPLLPVVARTAAAWQPSEVTPQVPLVLSMAVVATSAVVTLAKRCARPAVAGGSSTVMLAIAGSVSGPTWPVAAAWLVAQAWPVAAA
jgi:hypothetical protein